MDRPFLRRLARHPGHDLGGFLGLIRFLGHRVVGPAAFLADGEKTGTGEDAQMLGGRRRRESEEFLHLANAKLPALGKSAENADPVQVREGFGNGEDVSHGVYVSVISP